MSRLTQKGQGAPIPLFGQTTDTSLETAAGLRFDSSDGREFVIVRVGASSIGAGLLVQSGANVANHLNGVLGTAAVGAVTIPFTPGNTAMTANQYRGGFLVVNAGTGLGQTLKIASHAAISGSTLGSLTLEDPVQVATSGADSKGSLYANPALDVIVAPATTLTGTIVGATIAPVTAANYALLQTKGLGALYSESNIAGIGAGIIGAAATAGWGRSATGTAGFGVVGVAASAAVSAETRGVIFDL